MATTFVPLNSFKSVVANLTGQQDEIYITPSGVSTIVLSSQITNNGLTTEPVTIFVLSNAELPIPQFGSLETTSSFTSASALLELNRQFIRKEVAAYVQFENNLSEIPFTFTSSRFEGYALATTDAIAYDIANAGRIRTTKEAKSFYTKNGVSNIITGEYSASLLTLDYVNTLAQQIILNQPITASLNVSKLYQNTVTQSYDLTYSAEFGSAELITNLINVIKTTISNPFFVAQEPVPLVTNVLIPSGDSLSPVVAGKLVLEQNYGFVVSGSTSLSVILSVLESANE
jgi:hypothetical protein